MRIARIGAVGALLALLCVGALSLTGCQSANRFGPDCCPEAALPPDLPANPDPCAKYCKVWVPPTYRDVPKLVQCKPSCEREVCDTVMETRAREVMVKPGCNKAASTCGRTCEESLVQVKPGGYRWENNGDCWQYCYRKPEYKWCEKTVQEDKIEFCYQTPPEYKTVVETVPVKRTRTEYVPPEFKIRTVQEVFTPGHYEWRASPGGCTPDRRAWTAPRVMSRDCVGCAPAKSPALDCACPPTN